MAEFHMTTAGFARLVQAMFGPGSVPPRTLDEDRWLDDGGALVYGEDGYEHEIIGPRAFALELPPLAGGDVGVLEIFDPTDGGIRSKGIRQRDGRFEALLIFDAGVCDGCGRQVAARLARVSGHVRPAWSCDCGRAWGPVELSGRADRWRLP